MAEVLDTSNLIYNKGTFYVKVPKAWIEKKKLQQGDKVATGMNDKGDLIVKPATEVKM